MQLAQWQALCESQVWCLQEKITQYAHMYTLRSLPAAPVERLPEVCNLSHVRGLLSVICCVHDEGKAQEANTGGLYACFGEIITIHHSAVSKKMLFSKESQTAGRCLQTDVGARCYCTHYNDTWKHGEQNEKLHQHAEHKGTELFLLREAATLKCLAGEGNK